MSAKDIFHHAVRSALVKEGWKISHDPLTITSEDITFFVDLGGECLITAERDSKKIAVEIKSFLRDSMMPDFHTAIGQVLNYHLALSKVEPERVLYLAIPNDVYESFFSKQFVKRAIKHHQIKLIVFNPDTEEVVQWL
ncbi:XisH family protein [Spirulina sp. 06S082]|uniref:XisH family protein n=1 Tax=Spirulina sp. 06S082 TaxID=3110248 RepID=UPI002B1F827F|nr:XisH family protein [Spirulina sp. 06S082]MEA5468479.1 XisH family protein [Spirulina sp. 06S082]